MRIETLEQIVAHHVVRDWPVGDQRHPKVEMPEGYALAIQRAQQALHDAQREADLWVMRMTAERDEAQGWSSDRDRLWGTDRLQRVQETP